MEAFKIPFLLKDLKTTYPDAKEIQSISKNGGEPAREAIIRLWLSEGIPFAFKECPVIYESLRSWISLRLNIDPKDISMTGSGRIGQSLSPNKIGKVFDNESDLDLFIISDNLFDRLKKDFNTWSFDYESGILVHSNERENGFWKDNYTRGAKNLSKGFLDTKLIPNLEKYETAKNIAQTMWLAKEKLSITPLAPKVSSISVRCYNSWNDFVRQVSLSLR